MKEGIRGMLRSSRKFSAYCLCAVGLAFMIAMLPPALPAQSVSLVKRFSTSNGTIDFLPGAWVSTWEEGHSKYYKFREGQFVRMPALPSLLDGWQSFDWGSVDTLDQIAMQGYDPEIDKFLPPHKKVKQVEDFSPGPDGNHRLVMVCYTLKTTDKYAISPDDTDIYLTVISATREKADAPVKLRLLWTRRIETNAAYGGFTVERVAGAGWFALLYWGASGGSGSDQGLDVYRVTE